MKYPKPVYETLAMCIDNEGESQGISIATKLSKGSYYRLRNIAEGVLYGGEPIADVYDKDGNKIILNEEVTKWRINGRFALFAVNFLN